MPTAETTSPPSPDAALVTRLLAGEEAAFAGLVRQHQRALAGVAYAFVRDRDQAAELVQETWLAVLTGLPRFEGRSSLKTWIFRILANRARTRLQREGRTTPFSSLGEEAEAPLLDPERFDKRGHWALPPRPWVSESPERLISGNETLALIERALEGLPQRQRAVLLLRDVEELDSDEVCALLELSEGNQRVLLHRARTNLRSALEASLAKGEA